MRFHVSRVQTTKENLRVWRQSRLVTTHLLSVNRAKVLPPETLAYHTCFTYMCIIQLLLPPIAVKQPEVERHSSPQPTHHKLAKRRAATMELSNNPQNVFIFEERRGAR